jgi:predicted Zn-dependent protease
MLSTTISTLRHYAAAAVFALGLLGGGDCRADDNNLDLPDMGSTAGAVLSPIEERRLGDAFMRSVRQSLKLVEDPLVDSYIKSLGNLLVGFSGHHPFDFTFFVVDDSRINAFAGPGGYIGVNSGLILATESESELASVLGHELAHVTQHHLVRSFEAANKMSLPTAAAVIAAIIVGAQNPQVAEALLAAGVAGSMQTQLNFSRLHEQEADRVGIETLSEAGFDPRAMPAFFERLQQNSRYAGSGAPEFLSTHPVTLSRIADSRGRAEKFQYRQFSDSIEYHLTRERLNYLADKRKPSERVREVAANLKSGKNRNEFAARYAYVLALTANNEFNAAREQISELLRRDRERVPYFAAQAQIEISAGKQKRAMEILQHALSLYPHDTPLTFLLCDTLMDSGDIQRAHAILVSQGRYETGNPAYYQLLAKSAERLTLPDEAHEAWAEYFYLIGRLPLAIEHLRTALRQREISFYAKSRIEARLRELESELPRPGNRAGDEGRFRT